MEHRITQAGLVSSYRQWGLDPSISPEQIKEKLLGVSQQGRSSDGKVQHRWEFIFDGKECAIWDFKGVRWSAYGPREAFEVLGFTVAWED